MELRLAEASQGLDASRLNVGDQRNKHESHALAEPALMIVTDLVLMSVPSHRMKLPGLLRASSKHRRVVAAIGMTSLKLAWSELQAAAARQSMTGDALSPEQTETIRDSTPGVKDRPKSDSSKEDAEDKDAGVRVVGVDPDSDDGAH